MRFGLVFDNVLWSEPLVSLALTDISVGLQDVLRSAGSVLPGGWQTCAVHVLRAQCVESQTTVPVELRDGGVQLPRSQRSRADL